LENYDDDDDDDDDDDNDDDDDDDDSDDVVFSRAWGSITGNIKASATENLRLL